MLGEALVFPTKGDEGLRTIVIGGILLLLFALVVPTILVGGYLVRMVRAAANDDPHPPEFTDWTRLFVDGLKLIAVSVVYFLPAAVLFSVARVLGGTPPGGATGAGPVAVLVFLVAALLALGATYLVPAGIASFAVTESLRAAFDVEAVTGSALTAEYAVAVVLALAVGLVVNVVGSLLLIVLFGGFLIFYGQSVVYYLFGRGFARGRDGRRRRRDAPPVR